MSHRKINAKPFSPQECLRFIADLHASSSFSVIAPTARHLDLLELTISEISAPSGNIYHNIETAVIMREHGVPEILTADTHFHQFRFLRVTDPVHAYRA